jgi:hypothetical protein
VPELTGVFVRGHHALPWRGRRRRPARRQPPRLERHAARGVRRARVDGRVSDAGRRRARPGVRGRGEAIPRGKTFLAGTGADSTRQTIVRTKRAAEIGADVAIVVTPHCGPGVLRDRGARAPRALGRGARARAAHGGGRARRRGCVRHRRAGPVRRAVSGPAADAGRRCHRGHQGSARDRRSGLGGRQ